MTNMLNSFSYQREANISCLLEDGEYEERKKALLLLLKAFNDNHIPFAVLCSFNLFLRGIVDEFHDFDILIDIDNVDAVKGVMESIGATLVATGGNGFCESDIYLHYQLDRVDVDIIAGFRVRTYNTELHYAYNPDEIQVCRIYEEKEIDIPLVSLEALFLLYAMMEGWQAKRRFKRVLIGDCLYRGKIKFPKILERYLNSHETPSWVKREIRRIMD